MRFYRFRRFLFSRKPLFYRHFSLIVPIMFYKTTGNS